MPTKSTKVIALLSGTGGSGKTSIALELGRTFALAGKKALVVTDAPGVTASRFEFDNPKIVSEKDVRLTSSEVRDLRQKLIDGGVIDRKGQPLLSGIELFIASGDLARLNAKTCGAYSLDSLRLSAEIIILDDVVDPAVALGVCDLVIFVFDASHWASLESTEAAFRKVIAKNRSPNALPGLRSLLTNVGGPDNDWSIHSRVKEFELPVLHTVISTAHRKDRIRVGHAYGNAEKYKLLVDDAPNSLSTFEYDSLARELMKELAMRCSD